MTKSTDPRFYIKDHTQDGDDSLTLAVVDSRTGFNVAWARSWRTAEEKLDEFERGIA